MEISIIYKNVTGGVTQFGLPERRVSDTIQVGGDQVDETIDVLMGVALRRLENAEASGSKWIFHSFVSVTMRVSTNVSMNSDLVDELIGGNGDGQQYILSEAVEDGATADDEDEEENDDEVVTFIDDREVEDDVAMYREVDDDEVIDRDQVIVTPKESWNLDDYKIPDDETVDLLSGEDSDHNDREPREKTREEACDILGVTLAPNTAASMNAAIDKVTIVSNGEEGSCTYRAILNGIFARKYNVCEVVSEERFQSCLPDIYRIVSAFKEELQYVTVGEVANIMVTLNERLVKMGYAINIYERKPQKFLIDVITNKQQNNSFMISVVQAMYLYSDLEGLVPDQIHLMFKRVEGTRILDMGVCTDISVIIKAVQYEKTKNGSNFRLKKLYICEKCRVCYIRKTVYAEHVRWCKGRNSQQFLFEKKQDFETYEEFVPYRDTPLITAYYDLETETSHDEFKVISFSYVVAFRKDLCMQNIIVFRSAIMDVEALTTIPMGADVRSCLDNEDMEKITMCAHDVISQRPHAMTQLLVMELTTIQRAFGRAMEYTGYIYGFLPQPKIDEAMVDYCEKKCYLCGFGLNNIEPVPFRECVVFFLRKLYLEEYCQTIVEKPDPNEWTEDKLVSVWLELMETIHSGESTISDEEIAQEKMRRGMESFHVPHCCLVMRAKYPNHRVYMTGELEQELLNILNDEVVVHHCHFTGMVYGPVHKRCNSKVRIDPFRMRMHIYAHNATFFDNAFILKGINLSLLARKGKVFPYLNLMGENPSSVKTIQLDNCVFKDSLKLFESSLDDLCKLKFTMETIRTGEMIAIFLLAHEHFGKIYRGMTNDESDRLMALLNGKGYFCYDYITSRDVLKETSLPPLEMFKNQLDQKIPDAARYKEAEEIWKLLQCRNIDDYNCIYNVMDTINLAVIMEERMITLKDYLQLDPRHFTSMSVYGAACAKYKTRSIVQCMPNERIMEAIEDGTHGGFANVSTRRGISSAFYDEAMYIRDGEKVLRVMSTIEALDENNQYGGKMCQNLCRGGWRLRQGPERELSEECMLLTKAYTKEDTVGYYFEVSMILPRAQQIGGREETYPSTFEKESVSLELLSPYQMVHLRRKAKRPRPSKKFNKLVFSSKNMGTMLKKTRVWVMVDLLQLQVASGWIVHTVHSYYSFLQGPIMRSYIEENQARRIASTSPVIIKLMKDANNKAFGANTQRIKNRSKIIPIYDRDIELKRTVERSPDFEASVASVSNKVSLIEHGYEQDVLDMDGSNPDAHCVLTCIKEKKDRKLGAVDNIIKGDREKYFQRTAASWSGNAENDAYQHLRKGRVRSIQECPDARSIQYILTEKERKVKVKSTKFVGTHILTKAKVSIIEFTYGVCDTFEDPVKNPSIAQDMILMGLTRVIPSVILTDTDSVYLNFLGIYDSDNPLVTEEYFQQWVRESIIYCNRPYIDTSNLKQTGFKEKENYKKLDMFQFLTPTPNFKQVVAVNPKEYYCLYGDGDSSTQKHKGIPNKIRLEYEDYSNRVRNYEFLKSNEGALKSASVTYAQMLRQKNKIFIRDTMSKVKIGRLSDKMYIFSNGITTAPSRARFVKVHLRCWQG